MGEIVFLSVLLAICGYFFYLTFGFKVSMLDKSGGAGVFPRIVIIFLAIMIIIRIIQILTKKEKKKFVFAELFTGMRLFFFASLVIYVIAIDFLGYIASTLLFLFVVVNVFYYKSKGNWGSLKSIIIRNIAIVVFVLALYLFFSTVLHMTLPMGFWPKLFA